MVRGAVCIWCSFYNTPSLLFCKKEFLLQYKKNNVEFRKSGKDSARLQFYLLERVRNTRDENGISKNKNNIICDSRKMVCKNPLPNPLNSITITLMSNYEYIR